MIKSDTDAVQAIGKVSFDLKDIDADLLSISSHKIGGGFGGFQELRKTFVKEVKIYLSSCQQVTSDERFSGWDMRCFLYAHNIYLNIYPKIL